jgi:hypothetical protein
MTGNRPLGGINRVAGIDWQVRSDPRRSLCICTTSKPAPPPRWCSTSFRHIAAPSSRMPSASGRRRPWRRGKGSAGDRAGSCPGPHTGCPGRRWRHSSHRATVQCVSRFCYQYSADDGGCVMHLLLVIALLVFASHSKNTAPLPASPTRTKSSMVMPSVP